MAATIKDIAKQTGLGLATISKYLNGGNVRDKNKKLIDQAVKDLDYKVNEFARGLKSNKSMSVGVLIPRLDEIFAAQIVCVVEEELRAHGYSVIICDSHANRETEAKLVQFFLDKRVDGIINMPIDMTGEHLQIALEEQIPVVVFDQLIQSLLGKVDFVLADNMQASTDAVSHLIQCGHQNIGIIVGPDGNYTAQSRTQGYRQTLEKHGIAVKEEYIFQGAYSIPTGYEKTMEILEHHPDITAIFATNYALTLGAIMAINAAKAKTGRQISFVGLDNIELTTILAPVPAMVSQPIEQIGKTVAAIMLDHLHATASQKSIAMLATSFEEGESVLQI